MSEAGEPFGTGPTPRPLHYRFLGRRPYRPTWDLQREVADALRAGTGPETLLALEHDPVITIGRRGDSTDILAGAELLASQGVDVVEVDRGGEVTYHGPGQLVVYPIVALRGSRFGVGDLVRGLAAAIGDWLGESGIDARYDPEHPGLWVGDEKICAVGMRIRGGVSTHGAAVNLSTDLDAFKLIVPCGLPAARATSVAQLTGRAPGLAQAARHVAEGFAERLGFDLRVTSNE